MVQFKALKIRLLGDYQTSFKSGNYSAQDTKFICTGSITVRRRTGLELLLKPLGFKDVLVIFNVAANEATCIRKEMIMPCSHDSPCLDPTKRFATQHFDFHSKNILKKWGILHGKLICTHLKLVSISRQLGKRCLSRFSWSCMSFPTTEQ